MSLRFEYPHSSKFLYHHSFQIAFHSDHIIRLVVLDYPM
jgi:hypothetical protein